jgi:uncharacterized membrane protein YagU involved in acid resistance
MTSSTTNLDTAFASSTTSKVVRAIALGGLAVGVLDAIDGVAYFGLTAGNNPIQVLQYIASGAVGASAFTGGLPMAGLGALLHFALAFGFAGAFVVAYARSAAIRRHGAAAGLAWGAVVWAIMNLLVLPHSAVPQAPLTALAVIHGVIGHALFVGLTSAVVARRVISARS